MFSKCFLNVFEQYINYTNLLEEEKKKLYYLYFYSNEEQQNDKSIYSISLMCNKNKDSLTGFTAHVVLYRSPIITYYDCQDSDRK